MILPPGWPNVDPKDDGIRPAGASNACFYCKRVVGQLHDFECPIVQKRIEMRVFGLQFCGRWETRVPFYWDEDRTLFRFNESTFCASSLLDELPPGDVLTWTEPNADPMRELAEVSKSNGCLCQVLSFDRVRVIDETPQRDVRQ